MSITFKHVFIAVTVGTALLVAALLVNRARPAVETDQPTADLVSATGKCAACHRRETSAVVHQFERSRHARVGVNCLDCHRAVEGQTGKAHHGFEITSALTSKNCAQCHSTEYDQFERSRHAAPAWAAVAGRGAFTAEQLARAERQHPGAVDRAANALANLEGQAAITKGCEGCHSVGKPNADGSFGTCTPCHSRHRASIALARSPATCGQCHMGPDHSQLEIYNESKHGALFAAFGAEMNLSAPPSQLTTADMPIPTCATCHMSGLDGLKVSHDVGERLSWFLFAPVSEKRHDYERGQQEMKEVCLKCHAKNHVERFYVEAEQVLHATNAKVSEAAAIIAELRREGRLTPQPFDEEIEFVDFDLWHYYGRTAKHGAFMGGADFVQWHGNYELLYKKVELEKMAAELRGHAAK
jgi:cytochrome c1